MKLLHSLLYYISSLRCSRLFCIVPELRNGKLYKLNENILAWSDPVVSILWPSSKLWLGLISIEKLQGLLPQSLESTSQL